VCKRVHTGSCVVLRHRSRWTDSEGMASTLGSNRQKRCVGPGQGWRVLAGMTRLLVLMPRDTREGGTFARQQSDAGADERIGDSEARIGRGWPRLPGKVRILHHRQADEIQCLSAVVKRGPVINHPGSPGERSQTRASGGAEPPIIPREALRPASSTCHSLGSRRRWLFRREGVPNNLHWAIQNSQWASYGRGPP
jgi:hypothetical protein